MHDSSPPGMAHPNSQSAFRGAMDSAPAGALGYAPGGALGGSVRAVCPVPGGGRVVTMGFPGLCGTGAGPRGFDPALARATLACARRQGVQLLLVLVERHELPEALHAGLRGALAEAGLRGLALPIADYGVPSPAFLRAWRRLGPTFRTLLARDGAIGMACHHGAGRSGTVAAMHLIDAGLSCPAAVALLRDRFPPTVETEGQLAFLHAHERSARHAHVNESGTL